MSGPLPYDPEVWRRLEPALDRLLELPVPERALALDRLTAHEPELARALIELLGEEDAPSPLDAPADRYAVLLLEDADAGEAGEDDPLLGSFVESFRLVRRIGRGGMGAVYLGERADGQFEQRVAIKLIRAGLERDFTRPRFREEQRILARLEHPCIARLISGGLTGDGRPYIAMEYVQGMPITSYCDARGLGTIERLRLFEAVCGAVQYAHRNLVVHRDIKPSNILVSDDGVVKLVDFGIAKLLLEEGSPEPSPTQVGARALTPDYAAPEQVRGLRVDAATDIYSLGVVLYELLTGRRPYVLRGRSAAEIEHIVCEQMPERPSVAVEGKLRRRLAGDLDNVVLRALAKEPDRRYASAEALAEDVRRHLAGLPVAARSESRAYRGWKFVRRHRVGVGAAALLVLALSGGLAGTTWQARRAALEAARAGQVRDLLVSVFSGADPDRTSGADVTARELLEDGAARIRSDLADQPRLQADMLLVIADAYESLGLYRAAIPLVEDALALRLGTVSEGHPAVAEVKNERAWLAYLDGDLDAAETGLTEVVAVRRRLLGPSHPDLARSLDNLSETLRMKGRFAEAEELAREALAMRRALLGEHPDVATSLNNLAVIVRQTAARDEAEALYREAHALDSKLKGPDHRDALADLNNLANLLREKGELQEAEAIYRDLLERQRARYGDEHPLSNTTRNNLASVLANAGRPAEAEPLFRGVVEWWQRRDELDHPNAITTRLNLGQVLRQLGQHEEAVSFLREGVAASRRVLGDAHGGTVVAISNLASALVALGDYAEAEPLYTEALAGARSVWPESHPLVATIALGLGRVLEARGRCAQAMPLLQEAALTLGASGEIVPGSAAEGRILEGTCLLRLGRAPEAEAPLLAAFAALEQRPERQRVAAERLIDVYQATGRAADAAEYRRRLANLPGR